MPEYDKNFPYIASREDEYVVRTNQLIDGYSRAHPLANWIQAAAEKYHGVHTNTGAWLLNGGRLYFDNILLEYATPECGTIEELTAHSVAGEKIIAMAALQGTDDYNRTIQPSKPLQVSINKKNAGYTTVGLTELGSGSHENFLIPRWLFPEFFYGSKSRSLASVIVARTALFGAGFVESNGKFRIAAKLPHHSGAVSGSELSRQLVNLRNEPHADPERFARLHITTSDALLSPWAMYAQTGLMHLVLRRLIDGGDWDAIQIEEPAQAVAYASVDKDLNHLYPMRSGKQYTAMDILEVITEKSAQRHEDHPFPPDVKQALDLISGAIDLARQDPAMLRYKSDWATKLAIIERAAAKSTKADMPTAQQIDNMYGLLVPDIGYALQLREKGVFEMMPSPEQIERAEKQPPNTTRALGRGALIQQIRDEQANGYPKQIGFDPSFAVDWSRVSIRNRGYYMPDPSRTYYPWID